MVTTPRIRTEPTHVTSANVSDLSLLGQISVFMIVGGIILTFILIFACRPLAMIGVLVAFGGAGLFFLTFWRDAKKETEQIVEEASQAPSGPTESIKKQATEGVCPHCGKFIGYDGNQFCPFCGNRIILK